MYLRLHSQHISSSQLLQLSRVHIKNVFQWVACIMIKCNMISMYRLTLSHTVSVLGRGRSLCLKEFPRAKPEGTPEGKELYLTLYPESVYRKKYQWEKVPSGVWYFFLRNTYHVGTFSYWYFFLEIIGKSAIFFCR